METLTEKSKLTKEQIALCFGERTGYDVEPKDIRVRGNWLFHRTRMGLFDRYDKEVDCYWAEDARYNSGVLCMEPWDAVEYENSPFIPKNDKKVSIELKRLDEDYQQHLYEQTEEGQLEKRQEKAVSEYLNNIIQNDKEFKNKCIDIRNKIQDELDKKYGKNKKFALGIGTDDMRKANLITPEMEARMQEIRKEVV